MHRDHEFLQPGIYRVRTAFRSEKYYSILNSSVCCKRPMWDLPGEATTIMHNPKNIGQVGVGDHIPFRTVFSDHTFGQLATTVSSIINGGNRVGLISGAYVTDEKKEKRSKHLNTKRQRGLSVKKTSETVRMCS